uniref:MULE transposase domain-containing protein n=1 Tax=Phytophthora ramorum TaxID=164328 RepID=H3H3V0_PHYRM
MPRYLPSVNLAIALPRADADMLLETFKSFTVSKSDLGQCCICTVAAPHSMRTQLLRCSCDACKARTTGATCPWRDVDEGRGSRLGREGPSPAARVARADASLQPVVGTLGGCDLLKTVRLKIRDAGYTRHEEDSSAFTFSWRNDTEGRPIIGNGTDQDPFVVGITTKKLLQNADRDPGSFILHIDATYKLSQTQEQYTEVLSSLRRVYQLVTGKDMCVQYAMGDADLAQWAALQDAFSINSAFRFLIAYFEKVWLNEKVWRWQCFHTASGYTTTTNPCETFNAAIKRDVTMRRRLKVGALVDQLMILCGGESVRAKPFATTTTFSDRLARRARALTRDGLLYEKVFQRGSITSLLADAPSRTTTSSIRVMVLPATHVFDDLERRSRENHPATAQLNSDTARMERLDMPLCGWEVDTEARTCPCCFNMKHGSCFDATGRETLFYRGTNKRKCAQARTQPAGRPRVNGHALHME